MGKDYKPAPQQESPRESPSPPLRATLTAALGGLRLDLALVKAFPQYSRSRLQAWLKAGHVMVERGGATLRADSNLMVMGDERVEITPPASADLSSPPAQRMELAIVFEDRELLVLNKPAGLIVHPGAGNPDRTLMNALLAHAPAMRAVPRAGIVHRLDKDTSGLMVVAKNLTSQMNLAAQLADRSVKRTYQAVVHGEPPLRGAIDAPLGRDAKVRTRMAVITTGGGKEARTSYKVLERFERGPKQRYALVECSLDTGRTHQIRVHLQHIHHPVVGDPVYRRGAHGAIEFPRQALHAVQLALIHPRTGKLRTWKAPLPADMKKLLAALRRGDTSDD